MGHLLLQLATLLPRGGLIMDGLGLEGLVNLSTYPVEEPSSSNFTKLVAQCREIFLRQLPTTVASLAYDCLDKQGPLLRLYHTESFTKFIGDVLGLPKLFRLADPLDIKSPPS